MMTVLVINVHQGMMSLQTCSRANSFSFGQHSQLIAKWSISMVKGEVYLPVVNLVMTMVSDKNDAVHASVSK